jgi:2'-5' RNA ligase
MYRAHVTLARTKAGRLGRALVTAASKFADSDFGTFVADRYVLYQSTLKPSGAVYTPLREYGL